MDGAQRAWFAASIAGIPSHPFRKERGMDGAQRAWFAALIAGIPSHPFRKERGMDGARGIVRLSGLHCRGFPTHSTKNAEWMGHGALSGCPAFTVGGFLPIPQRTRNGSTTGARARYRISQVSKARPGAPHLNVLEPDRWLYDCGAGAGAGAGVVDCGAVAGAGAPGTCGIGVISG